MVISMERGADLHMAQLMPLPLTVSCFSEIQIGFTFLVLAHPGSPGKKAVKRVCVCVCVPSYPLLLQSYQLSKTVQHFGIVWCRGHRNSRSKVGGCSPKFWGGGAVLPCKY